MDPNQVEVADVNAKMVLCTANDIEISDRTFYLGDFCRSPLHPERGLGTVILVTSKVRVADVFTEAPLQEWVDSSLLMHYSTVRCGDHVIYEDWVGVVEEVLEEVNVKFNDNNVENVVEIGSGAFQPGDTNNVRSFDNRLFALLLFFLKLFFLFIILAMIAFTVISVKRLALYWQTVSKSTR